MDPMTAKLASLRLAPRQAAGWGHPETTGLPTMDFYLSAQGFEPEGAQAHYAERLLALPNLGCHLERAPVEQADIDPVALGHRRRRAAAALPRRAVQVRAGTRRGAAGDRARAGPLPVRLLHALGARALGQAAAADRRRLRARGTGGGALRALRSLAKPAGVPRADAAGGRVPRHDRVLRIQHRPAGRGMRPAGRDARGPLPARQAGERDPEAAGTAGTGRSGHRRLRRARGQAGHGIAPTAKASAAAWRRACRCYTGTGRRSSRWSNSSLRARSPGSSTRPPRRSAPCRGTVSA